jgi:hypothetical protein
MSVWGMAMVTFSSATACRCVVNAGQRAGDAADYIEGGSATEKQHDETAGERLQHVGADLCVEVVEIDAGSQHHLPGFEGLGVDGLAEAGRGGLARLRTVEINDAATGTAGLDDLVAVRLALRIRHALAALAELRRVVGDTHDNVIIVADEIAVRLEANTGKLLVRLCLRLLMGEFAGFLAVIILLHDRDARLHLGAKHFVALVVDGVGGRADLQVGGGAERHHQACDKQEQLPGNSKILHNASQHGSVENPARFPTAYARAGRATCGYCCEIDMLLPVKAKNGLFNLRNT